MKRKRFTPRQIEVVKDLLRRSQPVSWETLEREADADKAAGRFTRFESCSEFLAHLGRPFDEA